MASTKKVPPGFKKLPSEDKEYEKMMKSEYKHDPRPEIRVNSSQLPEITSWKVGETYPLSVMVTMESFHSRNEGGKVEDGACLRVIAIKAEK